MLTPSSPTSPHQLLSVESRLEVLTRRYVNPLDSFWDTVETQEAKIEELGEDKAALKTVRVSEECVRVGVGVLP